ncbi:hypothetical protein Pmani_006657 [Petrolisthes manimaculis]|uniref:Uncharacterized protein n=1 Tax=Petrolisthes manimaculis TaxID=1843537 RepID=A0AAE1UJE1_9EUCA|nr:hypothetical protein Pmani_006657 [Petrolisthes manimaculis]
MGLEDRYYELEREDRNVEVDPNQHWEEFYPVWGCEVSVWRQLSGPLSPAAVLPTPSPPLNEVGSKPSLVQPLPHPPRL